VVVEHFQLALVFPDAGALELAQTDHEEPVADSAAQILLVVDLVL